jgi:hypothetical protein
MDDSKFIIIAKVKNIFSPPGYWSGMFAAMQLVEYVPIQILKGEVKETSIVASHYVVSSSASVDVREDHPQLSPALFQQGRQLIVLLNAGPGKSWQEASACTARSNELCAMVSKDEQHIELAKAAKSNPVPTFTVESENCGVLPLEAWKTTVINFLK